MVGAPEFIVILVVLYALECFVKLGPQDLVFQARLTSRYRLQKPCLYPGNGNWGWLFLNPFRPTSMAFCSPQATFVLAEDGVLVRQSGELVFIHYKDCAEVLSRGGQIQIGLHYRFSPPAFEDALRSARDIAALAALNPAERRLWINAKIEKSLNGGLLQDRIDAFWSATRKLRTVASANCVGAFLLFPISVWFAGLRAAIIPAAIIAIVLSAATAALSARVWDQFYGDRPSAEKWMLIGKMVLYPVSALRPIEPLSLPLLIEWHPVALAHHLCDRLRARRFIGTILAGLLYDNAAGEAGQPASTTLLKYCAIEIAALTRFLENNGLGIEELTRPPEPSNSSCKTYCPKCMVQYVYLSGFCADCGHIALRPLKDCGSDRTTQPKRR